MTWDALHHLPKRLYQQTIRPHVWWGLFRITGADSCQPKPPMAAADSAPQAGIRPPDLRQPSWLGLPLAVGVTLQPTEFKRSSGLRSTIRSRCEVRNQHEFDCQRQGRRQGPVGQNLQVCWCYRGWCSQQVSGSWRAFTSFIHLGYSRSAVRLIVDRWRWHHVIFSHRRYLYV